MIEAGTYTGIGIEGSAQLGVAQSGTEQVAVSLLLKDSGEEVTAILSFTDKSEAMSLDKLKAMGWGGGHQPHLFAGIGTNEVPVRITYEEYNGKVSMKVDVVTGGRFAFKNEMDPAQAKNFLARLNATVKGAGGPVTPRTAAAPQQRPAPARQPQRSVQGPPPGRFDDDAPADFEGNF